MQKTIRFPRPIDSESLRKRSDKLANVIQEVAALEDQKKAEVKAYNDQIKMPDSEVQFLAKEIKEQTEMVDILCDVRNNYETGMLEYYEAGTDNLLKSEPADPTMFFDPEATKAAPLQLQAPRILNVRNEREEENLPVLNERNVVEDIQHEAA